MDLNRLEIEGLSLIEGEYIDSTLNLSKTGSEILSHNTELVILTGTRVIHLHGGEKRHKTVFASIQEIDAVEVTVERQGLGSLIWPVLALIISLALYFMIEHPIGRIAASITMALVGIYLIIDLIMFRGNNKVVTFKAGLSQFTCTIKNVRSSSGIYSFINRLFQLKEMHNPTHISSQKPF